MTYTSPAGPAADTADGTYGWGPVRALPRPEDRPSGAEVAVWLLRIPPSAAAAAARAGMLDARESERAARFRDDTLRERYVASHVGLRVLLGAYLGIDPAEVELIRELCGMPDCDKPHGRPAVAGEPGLRFSLSHAEDAAMYAFADAPVGADIEARNARRGGKVLAGLIRQLHADERTAIEALPETLHEEAFLSCWVRKEAYLKGIGTGLPGGLRTHHVGLADHLAPPGSATPPGWSLADVPAPPGYAAAVALRTDETAAVRPAVTRHGLSLAATFGS
ncbi:4'-phosphopantetheinyl transferase family protein [Streptomyces milbemycinicus]|uniref:4'-phosphopantetheinyl transferase family protein n=1 Tax=Streptomyces milbemycinicus TaxID=476552 RepID=UPI0033F6406C